MSTLSRWLDRHDRTLTRLAWLVPGGIFAWLGVHVVAALA